MNKLYAAIAIVFLGAATSSAFAITPHVVDSDLHDSSYTGKYHPEYQLIFGGVVISLVGLFYLTQK